MSEFICWKCKEVLVDNSVIKVPLTMYCSKCSKKNFCCWKQQHDKHYEEHKHMNNTSRIPEDVQILSEIIDSIQQQDNSVTGIGDDECLKVLYWKMMNGS